MASRSAITGCSGKTGYFDQSYHIPLIVRDPRASADATRGRTVDAFTENVDIMPTMLDWLGVGVPHACDGRSLIPFLISSAAPADWRSEAHWEFDFRDPDRRRAERALGIPLHACTLNVIRGDRYKYVHFAALPPLLFDLHEDPEELHNRADGSGVSAGRARVRAKDAVVADAARRSDVDASGGDAGRRRGAARAALVATSWVGVGSVLTATNVLPKLRPSSIARNASGAFSRPLHTSSLYFTRPSCSQPAISCRKLRLMIGDEIANAKIVHRDAAALEKRLTGCHPRVARIDAVGVAVLRDHAAQRDAGAFD